MKIRDRLALVLTITSFLVVTGLGIFINVFTARFHKHEFFSRLAERVQLTEQIFLEPNQQVSQAVRENFLHTLDEEKEYVIELTESGQDSLDKLFYPGISRQLLLDSTVQFWQGTRQGLGKRYFLPKGEFAVVVTAVDKFGQSKLLHLRRILSIGVVVCVAILVSVSWIFAGRLLQPLERKILKARHISADRLDLRLETGSGKDEIGQLAIAFNHMLDRLQASFLAQKHFVSNASHEILNPLTAIIGEAELTLEKQRTVEAYEDTLRVVASEAERLKVLTQQLLALAKAESLASLPQPEPEHLDLCLLEVLEKFPLQRIRLSLPPAGTDLTVLANRHLLHTALVNVIDNALKYSGEDMVSVSIGIRRKALDLTVRDRGIGIPAPDLANIYIPMHRARNARNIRGHGIGLPLAKKIIQLHEGSIAVESRPGEGTTVVVSLPRMSPA
jgi:signal transduction histidine kinase